MKNKDLKDILNKVPDDAELVFSKAFVIDKKDDITGILDIPILGVAVNSKDENEIRFVLSSDDVKSCFKPRDVKKL